MPSYREIVCITCNQKAQQCVNKKSSYLYCSNKCQQDKKMLDSIESGTASNRTLKRYLILKYGNKCWSCQITEWNNKEIIFELEHIDGNSSNNELNNLSILCPNCHSQTLTYKGKNIGNGRFSRRKRYSEGKSF